MAWHFYGFMYSQSNTQAYGPLPRKRWIRKPKEKHRMSYRVPTKIGVIRKSDSQWERTAIEYAEWLARRDGIAIPDGKAKAHWSGVYSNTRKGARGQPIFERRICSVEWCKNGQQLLWIDIPNWDWQPTMTEEHETELQLAA